MMKDLFKIIVFLGLGLSVFAQNNNDCNIKYSLFVDKVKTKKYAEAKPQLEALMQTCPKLSINIYKRGVKVAKAMKDAELMKKVYENQIANFPDKDIAKAHDAYAVFLIENKLGTEQEIHGLLEKAYKISPTDMSVKNIFRYFNGVYSANKDTNPQKVFDTYDDVLESIDEKLTYYSSKLSPLMEKEQAGTISDKEKRYLKAYTSNSKALGQVKAGLDAKIEELATCDRLIPLLEKQFEAKKTDEKWLLRAVKRLDKKDCQSAPMYEKLVRTYAEVTPSAMAYNFLAGVLEDNGDKSGAKEMRKKAFDLETDPNKKAMLKLKEAYDARRRGVPSRVRSLAYEALKYNKNLGEAYLLIANEYAKSANSCGSDEFEKRMVYVAALNKALKAQAVDPGCGAGRYISNYSNNIPSKKLIFNKGIKGGSSYRVGCWIGETVTVPNI